MLFRYAAMTKRIHYSTKKNSMHKLCDDVFEKINDFADNLAETGYGLYGKPTLQDMTINVQVDERDTLPSICKDCLDICTQLRGAMDNLKDKQNQGIVSLIDDFMGNMLQIIYLSTFE